MPVDAAPQALARVYAAFCQRMQPHPARLCSPHERLHWHRHMPVDAAPQALARVHAAWARADSCLCMRSRQQMHLVARYRLGRDLCFGIARAAAAAPVAAAQTEHTADGPYLISTAVIPTTFHCVPAQCLCLFVYILTAQKHIGSLFKQVRNTFMKRIQRTPPLAKGVSALRCCVAFKRELGNHGLCWLVVCQ